LAGTVLRRADQKNVHRGSAGKARLPRLKSMKKPMNTAAAG
jgi:hypothetical protein